MDEMLPLPGLFGAEPADPPDKFFVALVPDKEALEEIWARANALKAECDLGSQIRPQWIYHLTLRHLGDFHGKPGNLIASASEACAVVAKRTAPFQVVLDQALSYARKDLGRKPPFVLGAKERNEELSDFQSKIDEACRRRIARLPKENFNPHVTVTYDRKMVPPKGFEPIDWMAREVVLIHSFVGQTRHEALGRWILEG